MNYGELKVETLKLMFVNAGNDISADRLDFYYTDETYKPYLINIAGSLNRCFSVLETKGVLPTKSYTLPNDGGKKRFGSVRYDLKALIEDYSDIERVVYENEYGDYDGDTEYRREGDILIMPVAEDYEAYSVLYKPKIPRISIDTPDSYVFDIPDEIVCHIPHYLKGDLFRDDEPSEASEARNWFEQAMEELLLKVKNGNVAKVKVLLSQTEI